MSPQEAQSLATVIACLEKERAARRGEPVALLWTELADELHDYLDSNLAP
jgi:hypothetical protein